MKFLRYFNKIISASFHLLYSRIATKKYAKFIGVNFKDFTTYNQYGHVSWGTEPWIITIGSYVHITNNCTFITHDGGTLLFRKEVPDLEITKPITIGNNVYIGNNVTILPGVEIGNNVVIGACSVVTKNIKDNLVVAGNPAHTIKTIEQYREKLENESLGFGHLTGKEKDKALRNYYKHEK